MESSPYLSEPFISTWIKHFNEGIPFVQFNFMEQLSFVEHSRFPIYFNTGKTNTKGLSYTLMPIKFDGPSSKVFFIYDVHGAFQTKDSFSNANIGRLSSKQYIGYLCDLKGHSNLDTYMNQIISKSSRYKFRMYKRKLESSFNIHYRAYFGDIAKQEYEFLFNRFKKLLEKRFREKRIQNNNLDPKEWNFYKEVTFSMILKQQAALYVVYDGEEPIAITLLNFSKKIAFDVIRTFDIDYSNFRLGTISLMQQLQWCIAQGFETLDFSKGHFEYKKRWATRSYNFEYHIYYDSRSVLASFIAFSMNMYYGLKQFLRDKNLAAVFHSSIFWLRNGNTTTEILPDYCFKENSEIYKEESLSYIKLDDEKNHSFKRMFYEFLYRYSEHKTDTKLFKVSKNPGLFLIKGKNSSVEAILK